MCTDAFKPSASVYKDKKNGLQMTLAVACSCRRRHVSASLMLRPNMASSSAGSTTVQLSTVIPACDASARAGIQVSLSSAAKHPTCSHERKWRP